MFAQPDDMVKAFNENSKDQFLGTMIDHMEWSGEPGQNFHEGFKRYMEKNECIVQKRDNLYKPIPGGFNTLCHGDTWFNNMLFK